METIDIYSFLFLFFLIAPASLLFHEIGHVIGAKWVQATSIQLTLGMGKELWEGDVGNVTVTVRSLFIINSYTSTMRESPFQKKEKIIISLMGPIFSGVLALCFYGVYIIFIHESTIFIFFLFNLWLFFINLLPFRIGQKESDGYTICRLMITKNSS